MSGPAPPTGPCPHGVVNDICAACTCARMLVDPSLSVDDVIIAARLYYAEPGNECGGALHVALDDGNVEDGSIDFCARVALKVEPVDDGRPLDLAGYLLCGLLRRLGRDDRARVSEAMYP